MSPSERKVLLIDKQISQLEIAKELNISPSAVSYIMSGRARSYRVEKLISDRAGVPYEEMWGHRPRKRAA